MSRTCGAAPSQLEIFSYYESDTFSYFSYYEPHLRGRTISCYRLLSVTFSYYEPHLRGIRGTPRTPVDRVAVPAQHRTCVVKVKIR